MLLQATNRGLAGGGALRSKPLCSMPASGPHLFTRVDSPTRTLAPASGFRGLARRLATQRGWCVIAQATETKPDPVITKDAKKQGDNDDEQDITLELAIDPVSVIVVEASITALFLMVLAGWLGGLANIDPWSYYVFDTPATMLALMWSIPVTGALVAMAAAPTGVLPKPTLDQCKLMSKVEDDVIINNTTQIDLGELLFPAVAEVSRPIQDPEPVPATTRPLATGWRLFQLFVSKPWFPEFTVPQLTLITGSSGMQLAASELMSRGLIVALLANWMREAVMSADTTSWLFWGKVFRFSNLDTYRWVGTWAVAGASMWSVTREAGRMQLWARTVLSRLQTGTPETITTTAATAITDAPTAPASGAQAGEAAMLTSAAIAVVAEGAGTSQRLGETSTASISGREVEGITFVDHKRSAVDESVMGYFNSIQAALGGLPNPPPTTEDRVVWALAMAAGTSQVVLLAALFGTTGNLFAPLTARFVQEVMGNVLIRANAQGGPATTSNPMWKSGNLSIDDDK